MQGYPPPYPPPVFVAPPPPRKRYTAAIVLGAVAVFLLCGTLVCLAFAYNFAQVPWTVQLACSLGDQSSCQQWQWDNVLHGVCVFSAIGAGLLAFASGIGALIAVFVA